MPKGGARNKSGPPPDPNSRTSERKGYTLTALPNGGYDGEVPEFPLPQIARFVTEFTESGKPFKMRDADASDIFRDRELTIWAEAWATPQACAWSLEAWRWPVIAEHCRIKAIVENEPDANASLVDKLRQYRDQIGLTPAGLRENGWAIAAVEIPKAAEPVASDGEPKRERRLRSVDAQ